MQARYIAIDSEFNQALALSVYPHDGEPSIHLGFSAYPLSFTAWISPGEAQQLVDALQESLRDIAERCDGLYTEA